MIFFPDRRAIGSRSTNVPIIIPIQMARSMVMYETQTPRASTTNPSSRTTSPLVERTM
jgi:hypothetical protein